MQKEKAVAQLSITTLVDRLNSDHICLPSFQRDFVWKPDQMAKLLESVIRHYPIGTIMLLVSKGNEDLGKLSFVNTDTNAFTPKHYVIDGQQRLRTFLTLLRSGGRFEPNPPFEHEAAGANYKFFYKLDFPFSSIDELGVDKPTFIVPRKTEDHEKDDYEQQGKEHLIPVEFMFSKKHSSSWVKRAYPRHKQLGRNKILKKISEIRNRINNYSCPIEIICMKLKAIHHANMFRLLNEGGTDLTTFDLLTARFNPDGINLRNLWKASCRNYQNLEQFKVDPIYVLKTMLLIRQHDENNPTCTMREVKRIRDYYADEPSKRTLFQHDWRTASSYLDKAINILKHEFGVASRKYLPYSPMLIPLAAALWHVRDYAQRYKGHMNEKLRRWYWGAVFHKQFEKSTDTQIGKHFAALVEWLEPMTRTRIPSNINFKMTKTEIEKSLDRIKTTADAVYKAVLCMPLQQGADDIYTSGYLGSGVNLHDHHIFPKNFLKLQVEKDGDSAEEILEKMNHPINRMLITDSTNLEIKDKSPHNYLADVHKRILKRHFLFSEIVSDRVDFLEFFEKRKSMIVDYVHRNLIN
jgi:hypothetical protein